MAKIISGEGAKDKQIKGTVYISQEGKNKAGYKPIDVMLNYLDVALNVSVYDYLVYGITEDQPNLIENEVNCTDCDPGALTWFVDYMKNYNPPYNFKDFNLCITGWEYGAYDCAGSGTTGCGGPKYSAIEGAENLARAYGEHAEALEPDNAKYGNIFASLHEIGHNLGFAHGDGLRYKHNGSVIKTPMAPVVGEANKCGSAGPGELADELKMNWATCARQDIVIE